MFQSADPQIDLGRGIETVKEVPTVWCEIITEDDSCNP